MSQNVLVVGSGGREHAICWKLSQSPHVKQIFATPGSHAISQLDKVTNVTLDIKNFKVNHISLLCIIHLVTLLLTVKKYRFFFVVILLKTIKNQIRFQI